MTRLRLFAFMLPLLLVTIRAGFAGEIKPYSQIEFERLAAEGRPILLDFRADWCSLCAAQAPVLRELIARPRYKALTVFTISFDIAKELLKTYNVESQSTLIVFKGRQEQSRSVGETTREGIERLLNKVVKQGG